MIALRIAGATQRLLSPEGFDNVAGLSVRVELVEVKTGHAVPMAFSAWEPTPDELKQLNRGASVLIGISGPHHPVLHVGVEAKIYEPFQQD